MPEDINEYRKNEKKQKINLEIICSHCKESLTKIKYGKSKKSLKVTLMTLMLGGYGGHKIVEYFEIERYPMSLEHSIIESCISSDDKLLNIDKIKTKKKICVCTIEKTIQDYSYEEFKESQNKFFNTFDYNLKKCKKTS